MRSLISVVRGLGLLEIGERKQHSCSQRQADYNPGKKSIHSNTRTIGIGKGPQRHPKAAGGAVAETENMEVFASLVATAALPAYMGWAHMSLWAFALYAFVAGIALACGERCTCPMSIGPGFDGFARYAAARCRSVLMAGGLVYLLALALV
jgi:hypothetical protein